MALETGLAQVMAGYPAARQEALTGHPLAALITHGLTADVAEAVGSNSYKVTGSPGRGNWAEIPWVAVFDPLVTETAQRGFYVVYLFSSDSSHVSLSLNQGTTEMYELFGPRYQEELRSRALSFAALLDDSDTAGLVTGPVALAGTGRLARGYEAGNVFAFTYDAGSLPDEQVLIGDLRRLVTLYASLVERRDQLVEDADPAAVEAAVQAGVEAQRERWHKRTERNPRLARDAKAYHGDTCQVCGFNFGERFGELGLGYIEAHHLTPFAQLQGRPTQLDPRTDFAVLCPNCHRMLHRRTPPLLPRELRSLLRARPDQR